VGAASQPALPSQLLPRIVAAFANLKMSIFLSYSSAPAEEFDNLSTIVFCLKIFYDETCVWQLFLLSCESCAFG
jgi:hypothetical protein